MANTQQPLTSDGGFTTAANVSVSGNISVAGNIIGGAGALIWGNNITIGSASGNATAAATAYNVAIGVLAGNTMGNGSIAIGNAAGRNNQGVDTVIIGDGAGGAIYTATQVGNVGLNANVLTLPSTFYYRWQQGMALSDPGAQVPANVIISNSGAISGNNVYFSVTNSPSFYVVSTLIGTVTNLSNTAIAIGNVAGQYSQGLGAIAIGNTAGNAVQGNRAIAVGQQAGQTNQGLQSVAVGYQAGLTLQGPNSVAVGQGSAQTGQGNSSVAVGDSSGSSNQGTGAVAIGGTAGYVNQGNSAVAIGYFAGRSNQGAQSVAIASQAGNQGTQSLAIISSVFAQGNNSIAILGAGNSQAANAIALGFNAGYNQNTQGVAIGLNAGYSQGNNSIAIGAGAGNNQANNSIVLNATGSNITGNIANSFTVNPIRSDSGNISLPLYWNSATGEITFNVAANGGGFGNSISIGFGATAPTYGISVGTFSGNSYTANLANASSSGNTVSVAGNTQLFAPGQTVSGTGIVANTRIAGINYASNVITLTGNVSSANSNFTIYAYNIAGANSIAIGARAGNAPGSGNNSVAIGVSTSTYADDSVAIGGVITTPSQAGTSVAIGYVISGISANTVAIGKEIRFNSSGALPTDSIFIGNGIGTVNSGYSNAQGAANLIVLGNKAGNTVGPGTIAIGAGSGNNYNGGAYDVGNTINSIAIGISAAANIQYRNSIAIGTQAGNNTQGYNYNGAGSAGYAMALGHQSGQYFQGSHGMALGYQAGQSNQGSNAVAIGYQAGMSAATTVISNAIVSGTSLLIGANCIFSGPPLQVGMLIAGTGITIPSYITSVIFDGSQYSLSASSGSTGYISMTGTIGQGQQTVALGQQAGALAQSYRSVAIGYNAGTTIQGTNSVAIGTSAGLLTQGSNAVAIGTTAGSNNQGTNSVAIGNGAGRTGAAVVNSNATIANNVVSLYGTTTGGSFAVGQEVYATLASVPVGTYITATGINNVTISYTVASTQTGVTFSAVGGQSANAIAIGQGAGFSLQGLQAIAIGYSAGGNNQNNDSVAIGTLAGQFSQSANSVAVGTNSGQSQGGNAIAIGYLAGATQNANTVALGARAGQFTQGTGAVAVGFQAGTSQQGNTAVAVGYQAATQSQAGNAVAVGLQAGQFTQGANAVSVGLQAGFISQQGNTVALGLQSAQFFQGGNAIAIGYRAGYAGNNIAINSNVKVTASSANVSLFGNTTGTFTAGMYLPPGPFFTNNTFITSVVGNVLILNQFAQTTNTGNAISAYGNIGQGSNAIAIGREAAIYGQGTNAVALGVLAGTTTQGANAIAIGTSAGAALQGANSIAIGTNAGYTAQPANSIILNATGAVFANTAIQSDAFYVAPVRNDTGNVSSGLYYNPATNEITYAPISAPAIANGTSNISIPVSNGNIVVSVSGIGNTVTFTTSGIVVASAAGNVISTTGDVSVGNIYATNLFGNITTNAQPNITSVGTLSNLSVTGDVVTAGNLSVVGAVSVTGNTVLNNANILGTVSIASAAGTSLTVSGNAIVTGNLTVQGNLISVNTNNLNVANAIVGIGRLANNQPLVTNDGMDRGEQLWYYTTQEDSAFIGWQNSSGNILLASNVDIANNIVTVNNYGTTQAGNLLTAGYISAVGNVTAGNVSTAGNILTSGNISAVGNVTAAYFIGNIGNATGLSQITNGTSNVVVAANANVTVAVNGANVIDVGTGIISVAGSVNTTSLLSNKQIVANTLSNIGTTLYTASNNAIGGAKFKIYAQGFGSTTSVQMAEVLLTRDGTNNTSNIATTVYALINTNNAVANVSFAGTLNANRLSLTYNSSGGTYYYTYSVTEFVRT